MIQLNELLARTTRHEGWNAVLRKQAAHVLGGQDESTIVDLQQYPRPVQHRLPICALVVPPETHCPSVQERAYRLE
ncbi:MAG: hypothetical protein ABSC94_25220 [Polyangiaceae bacterium]